MHYVGLGTQLFVSIAVALFAGSRVDKWMDWKTPMLTWILPLVVIVYTLVKMILDTGNKRK